MQIPRIVPCREWIQEKYADNQYILEWWTDKLDKEIERICQDWLWYWCYFTQEYIVNNLDKFVAETIIENWKEKDPLTDTWVWYNVLGGFIHARAYRIGAVNNIPNPKVKKCPRCGKKFNEGELYYAFVKRLGARQIDVCHCAVTPIFDAGNDSAKKSEIIAYAQRLTDALGVIPAQNFGEGTEDFLHMNTKERLAVFKVLDDKPSRDAVKKKFGTWFHVLVAANVLEDGTQQMSRGIRCLAKDGHVCLSLGEKTIDDFLFTHGIEHEKEPHYPEGNYRADFLVGDVFIEYFGLTGNKDYDAKTRKKQRICKKHSITLVSIYPKDLVNSKKLEKKLVEANII